MESLNAESGQVARYQAGMWCHPRGIEEGELLARAQEGDLLAFDALVRGHIQPLFWVVMRRVGNRDEADDVLQETLLRAWRGIAGFRGGSTFFTWLYRIAVNEANRALDSSLRRPETIDLSTPEARARAGPEDEPLQQAQNRDARFDVESALHRLPLAHREAFFLCAVEGLSIHEAALRAGIGEAAFKSRLHKARRKLRTSLASSRGARVPFEPRQTYRQARANSSRDGSALPPPSATFPAPARARADHARS